MAGNPQLPRRSRWRAADRMRVSDAEREHVISQLCDRYAEGRLSHDTLDERVGFALRVQHRRDLADVLADLPSRRWLGSSVAACWQRGRAALSGALPRLRRPAAAAMPVLVFPAGEQRRFTIGRDNRCDMVLGDPTVSRWHAGLRREGTGWLLDDLGSTNGTRLNGWRVRAWVPVRAGDLVSFGAVTFVVGQPAAGRGTLGTL
jgi:Inner membrane component of T3SS, cytoplasmic domain/Domain of unknown function (DUF1707)